MLHRGPVCAGNVFFVVYPMCLLIVVGCSPWLIDHSMNLNSEFSILSFAKLSVRLVILTVFFGWMCSALGRMVYNFHSAYVNHHQSIVDDEWLRTKCNDPESFAYFRQHPDLCERVRLKYEMSPWLVAWNSTFQKLSACGLVDCEDIMNAIRSGGVTFVVLTAVCVLIFPTVSLPMMRWIYNMQSERAFFRQCSPMLEP